jgi:iron complex outermembrane receptor protein
LRPERATNFEVGGSHGFGWLHADAAVFYSRVSDAIVSFPTIAYPCTGSTAPPTTPTPGCNPVSLVQSRNLGHGDYYGGELSLDARLGDSFSIGGNYTYTHRNLHDPSNAAFRPTDVPTHKAFFYADWAPVKRVHLIPSLEVASDRWTVTDVAPIVYYRTGSYTSAGLRAEVNLIEGVDASVGVRNLFDDNYQLVDGFPEAGRSYFLSLRARYR